MLASLEQLNAQGSVHGLLCCRFRNQPRLAALYGTAVAEQLIAAGLQHLAAHVPDDAELIRLDPSTVAVIVAAARDAETLEQLAHRCAASWTVQTSSAQTPLLLSLAIGAALARPATKQDPSQLLSRAHLACQMAEQHPGSPVVMAAADLQQSNRSLYEQEAALHLAIQQRELTAFLQPIVNLSNGSPFGFECLARWPRSPGTMLTPAHFLNQAIAAGISAEIDLQVIGTALEAAPRLAAALGDAHRPLLLSANISAQLVENPRKVEELLQLLEQHLHTSPVQLQLELLEESLQDGDGDFDGLLNALARLGVLIAIDDFGTGYSSLSRVHNLTIQTIKVDRSFVQRINDPHKPSNHLLRTLIAIGHDLGIELSAEGIETEAQRQWLADQGCAHGQGFLFSEPLSLDAAVAYLRSTS